MKNNLFWVLMPIAVIFSVLSFVYFKYYIYFALPAIIIAIIGLVIEWRKDDNTTKI
jgi:4-amino-4-deoxy-L-arabinose transferase-like glycosyltransferase